MGKPFEKTLENYALLYQFSSEPYKPKESWTNSKTFTPDTTLEKSEFVLDTLFIGTDNLN